MRRRNTNGRQKGKTEYIVRDPPSRMNRKSFQNPTSTKTSSFGGPSEHEGSAFMFAMPGVLHGSK